MSASIKYCSALLACIALHTATAHAQERERESGGEVQHERWTAKPVPVGESKEQAPRANESPAPAAPTPEQTARAAQPEHAAEPGPLTAQRDDAGDDDDGSVLTQWWFWTGAAALLAGGAIAAFLLTDEPEPAALPQPNSDVVVGTLRVAP